VKASALKSWGVSIMGRPADRAIDLVCGCEIFVHGILRDVITNAVLDVDQRACRAMGAARNEWSRRSGHEAMHDIGAIADEIHGSVARTYCRGSDGLRAAPVPLGVNLTESHSLLAMAAVILLRRGNGIGWRPSSAGDVR
jgi:hypothetical protein